MLRTKRLSYCVLLVIAASSGAAEASTQPGSMPSLRDAIYKLIDRVDYFQEDVIEELQDHKERTLYRKAEEISNGLTDLLKMMSDSSRGELYQRFVAVDKNIHQLMEATKHIDNSGLTRAVRRIYHADLELHYALSLGDTTVKRRTAVLKQQAEAFSLLAKELERVAQYSQKAPVTKSIKDMASSAHRFLKQAQSLNNPDLLTAGFAKMDKEWQMMVKQIELLPPRQNVFLLRSAVRLDRIHARLHRLLGVKSKRRILTVQISMNSIG